MADKIDYKKAYKHLYLPVKNPVIVEVPAIPFLYCSGTGAPEGAVYQNGLAALYAVAFTIKMSKMSGRQPAGYFEYTVPPLEGLWVDIPTHMAEDRKTWRFTSLLRQPDFVTQAVFEWALEEAAHKKPAVDFSALQFGTWAEGLCAQALHLGPYATEAETLARISAFVKESGYVENFEEPVTGLARRHHEIYLSDPRKAKPETMKTVLRHPVRKRTDA